MKRLLLILLSLLLTACAERTTKEDTAHVKCPHGEMKVWAVCPLDAPLMSECEAGWPVARCQPTPEGR